MQDSPQPGSAGEHALQERYGTQERAQRFYRDQIVDAFTGRMQEFLEEQTSMTLSTADAHGQPSASPRFGDPGFVAVVDERHLAWPELRGNGVMTSLGNLIENPKCHLLFVDLRDEVRIGLHVNGTAEILEADEMRRRHPGVAAVADASRRPVERWVVLELSTAYVHCRKHLPRRDGQPVPWGTDDPRAKGGDFFEAKLQPKPWVRPGP